MPDETRNPLTVFNETNVELSRVVNQPNPDPDEWDAAWDAFVTAQEALRRHFGRT